MSRAISLARQGRGTASPNPIVGAVIEKNGRIIGEGYHAAAGGPHAEIVAIQSAGTSADGATIYVTLEPCNHDGRTGACTQAILAAGIKRVVFAVTDPAEHGEKSGAEYLSMMGLDVASGLMSDEAARDNRFFLGSIKNGRPWIVAKYAASLDGRIATHTGDSKWITGVEARKRAHELRRHVDAIIVGSGTVLADNPTLTVRHGLPMGNSALRIVLDARGRTPLDAALLDEVEEYPLLIGSTDLSSDSWRRALEQAGAEVLILPPGLEGGIDLNALLGILDDRSVRSVMIEGGAAIHGAFFDAGLVDEVWSFLSPSIIGGHAAPGAIGGRGVRTIGAAPVLQNVTTEVLGKDVLVRGLIEQKEGN